jgi:hypothetical protein
MPFQHRWNKRNLILDVFFGCDNTERRFLKGNAMATLLIVSLFLLLSIIPAQAAVFNIPSGNVTALIAAINTANANGEENTINLEAGTYTLTAVGLPIITSTLTLRGAGSGFSIIERNASAPFFRIMTVAPSATLNLDDLTIRGGGLPFSAPDGGGSIFNEGTVSIQRSAISGSSGSTNGGGGIRNRGTMTITSSFVSGFAGPGSGGGISNSGNLVIANSSITGNSVEGGGGGIVNGGTTMVTNSTISGAAYSGGGILNGGTLTLVNSTVTGGHAERFGGGGIDNRGGRRR